MDLERLKDAATGPSRVLAKLRRGGPGSLPEMDPPLLKFTKNHVIYAETCTDSQEEHSDPMDFVRLCLIPGGRLCIAFQEFAVLFYDLNTGAQTEVKHLEPVRMWHPDDWLFIPSPSLDGKEIRLAINQSVSANKSSDYTAEEISIVRFVIDEPIGVPQVKFQKTSLEVSAPRGFEKYLLIQDMYIYTHVAIGNVESDRLVLNVWNFMENTFASWSIPGQRYVELFYDDGHVAMVSDEGKLRGRKIPPLEPQHGTNQIPVQIIPEAWTASFERKASATRLHVNRSYEFPHSWYNTFQTPECFAIQEADGNFHAWRTYQIQQDLSLVEDESCRQHKRVIAHPLKSQFPRKSSRQTDHLYTGNPFFKRNDSLVKLLFSSIEQAFVVVRTPFSEDSIANNVDPEFMVELRPPEEWSLSGKRFCNTQFDFDPFSGRLAYISYDLREIVVVDYLKHPGASSK